MFGGWGSCGQTVTESVQRTCVRSGEQVFARRAGGHGGSAEPPPSVYMYKVLFVCSFLWFGASSMQGGRRGGRGVCVFVRVGGLLLCFEALEGGWCLCVSTPHTSATGDWRVANSF